MNEEELRALVKKKGAVNIAVELSLLVAATVLQVRSAYGRVDAYVTPVAGSGERWISAARITRRVK